MMTSQLRLVVLSFERLIQQDGVEMWAIQLGRLRRSLRCQKSLAYRWSTRVPLSLFTQGYKYLFAVLSTSEQYLATAIDMAADSR